MKTVKPGRKPLSIPYVFENERYLNILFLLYYCSLFRKKAKKKFLQHALIKNQFKGFGYVTKAFDSSYYFPRPEYETEIHTNESFHPYKKTWKSSTPKHHRHHDLWSLDDVVIHRTATTVHKIILQDRIRQKDLGFLHPQEAETFQSMKPEQFYYDTLFNTDKQLTKYLYILKYNVRLINNFHDTRGGTYWNLTLRGFQEIQKHELLLQINDLFQNHYEYYEKNKTKIDNLLSPVSPLTISWIPCVPWKAAFENKHPTKDK